MGMCGGEAGAHIKRRLAPAVVQRLSRGMQIRSLVRGSDGEVTVVTYIPHKHQTETVSNPENSEMKQLMFLQQVTGAVFTLGALIVNLSLSGNYCYYFI